MSSPAPEHPILDKPSDAASSKRSINSSLIHLFRRVAKLEEDAREGPNSTFEDLLKFQNASEDSPLDNHIIQVCIKMLMKLTRRVDELEKSI
jgi:hypothetical protein